MCVCELKNKVNFHKVLVVGKRFKNGLQSLMQVARATVARNTSENKKLAIDKTNNWIMNDLKKCSSVSREPKWCLISDAIGTNNL